MSTTSCGTSRPVPIEPRPSLRDNLRAKAGSEIVSRGLRAGLGVLAARWLGPAEFGAYAYAFGLTSILAQGADLGLHLHLTRRLAAGREPAPAAVAAFLRAKVVLASLAMVAFAAAALLGHGPATQWLVWLVGLGFLFDSFLVACVHVFRGFHDLRFEARASLLQAAAMCAFGVFALRAGWGAAGFATAIFVANALSLAIVAAWIARRFVPAAAWWHGVTTADAWRSLRDALPLGTAIVVSVLYFRTDVVWLGVALGSESAAVYSSAARLVEGALVVPAVALAAVFPAFSAAAARSGGDVASLYWRTTGALAGIATAGAIVLGGGASLVVSLLYGPAYAQAAPVLRVLAVSLPFMFVSYVSMQLLVVLGMQRANLILAIVCFAVNVVGLAVLVPRFGVTGAALAKLATEVLLFASAFPLARRRIRSGSVCSA